jgi:hypothetical protein
MPDLGRAGMFLKLLLLLSGAIALLYWPTLGAAQVLVEPEAIALTPDDLPAGFSVDPSGTRREELGLGSGILYRQQMLREPSIENLLAGPVFVAQVIIRIDRLIVPADMLADIRDGLIAEYGVEPVPGQPNDGGTVSLGRVDEDGTAVYAVGFVKGSFVIFTIWSGLGPVVDLPGLLDLAGITSARLDSLAAEG